MSLKIRPFRRCAERADVSVFQGLKQDPRTHAQSALVFLRPFQKRGRLEPPSQCKSPEDSGLGRGLGNWLSAADSWLSKGPLPADGSFIAVRFHSKETQALLRYPAS